MRIEFISQILSRNRKINQRRKVKSMAQRTLDIKPTPMQLAIEKIRRAQAQAKVKQIVKDAPVKIKKEPQEREEIREKPGPPPRRQTHPPIASTSSIKMEPNRQPERRSSAGERPTVTSTKAVKLVDPADLPRIQRGPNPKKSSFKSRKPRPEDNKLGYRGRGRHHRHSWQAEREAEYRAYFKNSQKP